MQTLEWITHFFGSAVCHQMAERSFQLNGYVFPVCARCTGIYLGVFFSLCFFLFAKRFAGNRPFSLFLTLVLAGCILPISIDGFFSYVGIWESNNFLRILSGSLVGVCLLPLFLLGANVQPTKANELPIFENHKEFYFLFILTLVWGLLLFVGAPLLHLSAIFVSIGIFAFWTCLFHLIFANILTANSKISPWHVSFLLSASIIIVIGVLRL